MPEQTVGDAAHQEAHAEMMGSMNATSTTAAPAHGMSRAARSHPGMSDPSAVSVEPGQTGEVVMTFGKVTQWQIGCHEPGHYEAGMSAILDIAK